MEYKYPISFELKIFKLNYNQNVLLKHKLLLEYVLPW